MRELLGWFVREAADAQVECVSGTTWCRFCLRGVAGAGGFNHAAGCELMEKVREARVLLEAPEADDDVAVTVAFMWEHAARSFDGKPIDPDSVLAMRMSFYAGVRLLLDAMSGKAGYRQDTVGRLRKEVTEFADRTLRGQHVEG